MEKENDLLRLILTVIFFRTPLVGIHKDKELQVMVKIRGRTRCFEVRKAISWAPRCLLPVCQLLPDLLTPRV